MASENYGQKTKVRRKHPTQKPPDIAKITTIIAGIIFFIFVLIVFLYAV